MASEPSTDLFRRRARAEAARYGSDPWVFVRELLQNARDAGARRIEIEVSRRGEYESVSFRDDGCGMSYQHARRYLFALYASSKEDSREQAGKFGIGFWSVLRFEPSTITIRSCEAADGAWQVSLDGGLKRVAVAPEARKRNVAPEARKRNDAPEARKRNVPRPAALRRGTEIVLERPVGDLRGDGEDQDLATRVMAATRHYGRFLTRRGDPETPLPVTVDGRSANAELELPAPCAKFRGKGFRGVVGLGAEPEVELFAQGLFVRSAGSLQDLRAAGELSEEATATTEDVLAELPSLAPRVLIDSAELDLMLARSDARHDKHLRRILRTAEKQLGRLVTRQLQAFRPQPFYRLWLGALRDRLAPLFSRQLVAATLAGLVLGSAGLWWLRAGWLDPARSDRERPGTTASGATASGATTSGTTTSEEIARMLSGLTRPRPAELRRLAPTRRPLAATGPGALEQPFHAYFDLAARYQGPRPGGIAGEASRLAMTYEPAGAGLFFAALIVDQLTATRWASSPVSDDPRPYRGARCRQGCIETRLLVAEGQEALRLPVPTGHRLDPSSVRLDGRPARVFETASGEGLLLPLRGSVLGGDVEGGVLDYRTGPAISPVSSPPAVPVDAPAELISIAAEIHHLPVEERVQQALDFVAGRIVYDRSPAAGRQYRLTGGGEGFVEATLDAGTGDCDAQSGVLVTLLRLAGVESRLALGYVGTRGIVAPGLHAWVEYRDHSGGWSVADASVTWGDTQGADLSPALLPPSAGSSKVRFPRRAGFSLPFHPALPIAAVALLLAGAAWSSRRRSAAGIELSAGEDLAALLGGALRHPEAFAGLPAIFHGRFVPLLGRRGAISLARARRMGRKNRLFRSADGSQLARRAAARGAVVIDASTAEGKVLSLALGAVDLDYWSSLLARSLRWRRKHAGCRGEACVTCQEMDLSRRINRRLDELGALFRLREVPTLPQPWIEIALEDLGLGKRQILIDQSHAEYAPVRALLSDHPQAAAFTVLDVLLHRVELAQRERARILAAFARRAVEEAAAAPHQVIEP